MRKVWIATAIYACVLGALEAYRWHIWSFGSDTGTFTQAVLDTAHGFRNGPEAGSHFLFHFSPILGLLYPIVAVVRSPLALQLAQVCLVALTAPALYALARRYLSERASYRVAVIGLLYPPLASIAFGEFHEVAFFPLLAIGLLYAADRRQWIAFALLGAACLLIREDICFELAAIGAGIAIVALRWRRFAVGTAFGLLGVAGALVGGGYYHWIYSTAGTWPPSHFYDYPFAQGPFATIAALVTHPSAAVPAIATIGRFTYLLEVLLPLALLPLRTWWALLALPGLGIVLLAGEQSVWRMGNHYAALWAPWVLVATAAALVRIERSRGETTAVRWANGAIAACILTLIAFNPTHLGHYLTPPYRDLASARAAIACVPHGASVATHHEWFSEIAASYPQATIYADSGSDYLVYADDFSNEDFRQFVLPQLARDVTSGRYSVVCAYGRVKTYRRQ